MPRHTTSTRRRVFVLLRDEGPMTSKVIARVLKVDPLLSRNVCSQLARAGILSELFEDGHRARRYSADCAALPEDIALVHDLTASYGADRMHLLVDSHEGAP